MVEGQSRGQWPNGTWEHVEVVTPEVANKLVLNRGAIFMKFSAKKGSVGMKSKAERHVCLAGSGNDQRICWAPPRQESQKVSDKASSSGMSIRSRLKRWSSKKLEGDAPRESSEVPPASMQSSNALQVPFGQ